MNYFLGIDPGKTGAFALIDDDLVCADVRDFPDTIEELASTLRQIIRGCSIKLACLEKVGAAPGQGVTSMFTFGTNFGAWQGILSAYQIPFFLAAPQKWMYGIFDSMKRGKDRKLISLAHAKRRFPNVDLSLKKHHGRADALNIALYARKEFSNN